MTPLLAVAVKTTLLVLLALTAVAALGRRSAAARHWVLAVAFTGCLCLPIVDLLAPSWTVPIPASWLGLSAMSTLRVVSDVPDAPAVGAAAGPGLPAPGAQAAAGRGRAATALAALWMTGALLGIGVLAAGLVRLRRIAALAEPVRSGPWRAFTDDASRRHRLPRPVRLLRSRHPTMVATWGIARPAIVLPFDSASWTGDRMRVVLEHELAHVRRGDWVVALAARVVAAVFWFNPLFWIAYRRLREEGERACDDLVLASGVNAADYAAQLLAVARECADRDNRWSPAIAVAHHSTLEGRIRAMLNDRVNRAPLTSAARAATLVLVTVSTAFIGAAAVSGDATVARTPRAAQPSIDPASANPGAAPAAPDPSTAPSRDTGLTAVQRTAGAAAQTRGGAIEGVLYDQFGGLLPGASVRLTAVDTGAVQSSVTSRGGAFAFRELPPGDYELVTELAGFNTVRNVVRADSGTVRRHITLPIGAVQETVSVVCLAAETSVARPTAPSASTTPGPSAPAAASGRRGVEPTLPSTFTGGIGGQIKAPTKISHVSPVCPSGAAAVPAGVRLAGRIGIDGLITDLHVVSGADDAYSASALEAVRQWVFRPTLLNGAPIEVNITIAVDYSWGN